MNEIRFRCGDRHILIEAGLASDLAMLLAGVSTARHVHNERELPEHQFNTLVRQLAVMETVEDEAVDRFKRRLASHLEVFPEHQERTLEAKRFLKASEPGLWQKTAKAWKL